MSFRRKAVWMALSISWLGLVAVSAAQDSELYTALAARSRETAAMARRTAEGERVNAERARENAETWREIAEEARGFGQEDNARAAEARAERAEEAAAESEAAAAVADLRAENAEREAARFDEKAGVAGEQEAIDEHVAVLTDPDTVFHRVYILGEPDNDTERDTWAAEQRNLQGQLEGAGRQAAGSTSTTLVTPRREDVENRLTELQRIATPGDELTLYYSGHGGGGPFWGGDDLEDEEGEAFEEHININGGQDITDDQMAQMLSGFAPGVSITLLMDSCFGGGFTGGSTDVQENNSVNVIGVGNTCPGSGDTLSKAAIAGLEGDADLNGDGVITAVELENYLLADGWDVRAPYDTSEDLSLGERFDILKDDILNLIPGAKIKRPSNDSAGETSTDAPAAADAPYDIHTSPESFNPLSGEREIEIQLMFVDSVVDELGGIVVLAEVRPSDLDVATPLFVDVLRKARDGIGGVGRGELFGAELLLTRYLEEKGALSRPRLRMRPAASAQAPRVSAFVTSLGRSYGPSMQAQFFNLGDAPASLAGDGLVLEPLKEKAQEEMQQQLSKLAGRNPVTTTLNAYCLEFLREPPSLGTVFRIADATLQEQFAPMRQLMDASQKLRELGRLTPDTEAMEYFHSIRQWSIWSKQEGFDDEGAFGREFVGRTKKNFEASGQPFTDEIEAAVRGLVPNRWSDIAAVLSEAGAAR